MSNGDKSAPRIVDLRLGRVTYDEGRPPILFGTNIFRYAATVAVVVCSDGTVGTGLIWTQIEDEAAHLRAVRPALTKSIVGLDPLTPIASAASCHAEALRIDACRISAAVEIALWDLAGRILNVPCYQLLGARRRSLPAYVISTEDFFVKSTDEYVELARRYIESGFRACKFHMWGDAARDIAACDAVRRAVGDDIALMLDPAGRYDRSDAAKVGRAIEELGFVRFEDPLPPGDAAGYRWLSSRVSVPIVVNETLQWNAEQCAAAAQSGTVQGFRMNIGRAGIGQALRMSAVAEANGAELDIAAFVPRGGLEACLQFALASPTTRWFEHHEASDLEKVPGISVGTTISNGTVVPGDRAGLGFDVDWDEFDRGCEWVS